MVVQGLEFLKLMREFLLTSHLKVPWRFEMARSAASLLEYLTKAHPDRGTVNTDENDVRKVSLSSPPIVSKDPRCTMTCHLAMNRTRRGGGQTSAQFLGVSHDVHVIHGPKRGENLSAHPPKNRRQP